MNWEQGKCPIWGTVCKIHLESLVFTVHSERAGGGYRIPIDVFHQITQPEQGSGLQHEQFKAVLSTWIASQQGGKLPFVSREIVDMVNNGELKPLNPIMRAERLLRYVSESISPGGMWGYVRHGRPTHVLVLTESLSDDDVKLLVNWLISKEYFFYPLNNTRDYVSVSLDGYQRLAELDSPNIGSDQVFVAMWFNDDTEQLRETIRAAVKAANLKPYFVDEDSSNQDKISDRIELEIRRSRLIVADFTHDDKGARGSVYYEAGLAKGLGLPVVWTCRGSNMGDLHFDTNHYPHLEWSEATLDAFQEDLTAKIGVIVESSGS